jgi:hypothetical protein
MVMIDSISLAEEAYHINRAEAAHPIDLAEAAHILRAHFGPRFAASHLGGRHRLVAVLCARLAIAEPDAGQLLAALTRRQAVRWEAARGLPLPCPGVLEICGDWLIQPERLQAL